MEVQHQELELMWEAATLEEALLLPHSADQPHCLSLEFHLMTDTFTSFWELCFLNHAYIFLTLSSKALSFFTYSLPRNSY